MPSTPVVRPLGDLPIKIGTTAAREGWLLWDVALGAGFTTVPTAASRWASGASFTVASICWSNTG
jgi:hypothetical protein